MEWILIAAGVATIYAVVLALCVAAGRADDASEALRRAGYLTVAEPEAPLAHATGECTGDWEIDRNARRIRCPACGIVEDWTQERDWQARDERHASQLLAHLTAVGIQKYGCDPARSPWARGSA